MSRQDHGVFNSIEDAIEDFRKGTVVIVVDDEDRENEGDFVVSAEKVTPDIINFFVREGRGVKGDQYRYRRTAGFVS